MAKKVYRVLSIIGRKRNVIWESKPFDIKDGDTDYETYNEAVRERNNHSMKLWEDGVDGGRIEIALCSK